MRPLPDLAAELSNGLGTVRFGRPLHLYDAVPSTNDVARALAADGAPEGSAVVALEQSAGRGRLGRRWASPPGGLYLSLVLRPPIGFERRTLLGLAMAVGAAEGTEAAAGTPVALKWPNDLVVDGRKAGGILVEMEGACAVAGIGINANVPPEVLDPQAATLAVPLVPFAQAVLAGLERVYDVLLSDPDQVVERWRARSVTLGQRVGVAGAQEIEGVAEDIDADGALLIRTASGLRRVVAGDVSLRAPGDATRSR